MLIEKLHEKKLAEQKRYPCHVNRASSIGEECERMLAYERVAWEQKALPSLKSELRFAEGRDQERIVLRDLIAAGIEVYEQQTPVESREHKLTGHMDGAVHLDGCGMVLEVKSCAPHIFDQVDSLDDFKRFPWMKKYLAQIQLYIALKGFSRGLFIFKSLDGRVKEFLVDLDSDFVQSLLEKASRINLAVDAWDRAKSAQEKEAALPPRIKDNAKKCLECPFTHICNPKIQFSGMEVLDSKALLVLLEERARLAPQASRYTKINDEIKARLGERELVMVGDWLITGKRDKKGSLRRTFEHMGEVIDEALGKGAA